MTPSRASATKAKFADDQRELVMQLDIQISAKRVIVVKIFEGDSAKELLDNVRLTEFGKEIGADAFERMYRVIRMHT